MDKTNPMFVLSQSKFLKCCNFHEENFGTNGWNSALSAKILPSLSSKIISKA